MTSFVYVPERPLPAAEEFIPAGIPATHNTVPLWESEGRPMV